MRERNGYDGHVQSWRQGEQLEVVKTHKTLQLIQPKQWARAVERGKGENCFMTALTSFEISWI